MLSERMLTNQRKRLERLIGIVSEKEIVVTKNIIHAGDIDILKENGITVEPIRLSVDITLLSDDRAYNLLDDSNEHIRKIAKSKLSRNCCRNVFVPYSVELEKRLKMHCLYFHPIKYRIFRSN